MNKLNKWGFCSLSASMMVAALAAAPLAYAEPGSGTLVTQFRSTMNQAQGSYCPAYFDCSNVIVQARVDADGVPQGWAQAVSYSWPSWPGYASISCSGPEYAHIISVNQGNGITIVSVTLDPDGPGCWGYNSPVITINFSGQSNGYHGSSTGTTNVQNNGTNSKYNFQSDEWGENFTGTYGFFTGTFQGTASTERNNNRQQVK